MPQSPIPTGIHLFSIPSPYAETINIYFAEDPPTLIDAPPNNDFFRERLQDGLKSKGYTFSDVERIIVTHSHFDHSGLAAWIVEQSGAEVWASPGTAEYLEKFPDEFTADFLYYAPLLERAGVPGEGNDYLQEFYSTLLALGSRMKVSRYLKEGDAIQLASKTYEVVHVPGHTPWCIMFYDHESRVGLTGDFLIKHITSNAVLKRPRPDMEVYKSLKTYMASLRKAKALGLTIALPGHGDVMLDAGQRIDEILVFILERKERVISIVRKTGTCTPFEVMKELLGDLPDWQTLLGISEVIGHLEILEEEGLVRKQEDDRLYFSAAP